MALSDILEPRLVQLGCIKIGRKSDRVLKSQTTGRDWSPPEKLDHFIITSLNRDARGQLVQDIGLMDQLAKDGWADQDGKLRRLPIRLLSNDPEDVMQAAWCWYASRSIGARSDGKTVTWFVGHHKDNWLKPLEEPQVEQWKPELEEWKDGKGNKMFKRHSVFNCVIASKGSRFGGVHKFRTTSAITGSQLYGGLLHISQLTSGILMGLPLQLVVRPVPVNPLVNGTHVGSTVFVVHVELIGSDLQAIQNQAMKQARFALSAHSGTTEAIAQYRRLLRGPGQETTAAEVSEISEEFHPESEEREPVPMPLAIDRVDETPPVAGGGGFGPGTFSHAEPPPPEPASSEEAAPDDGTLQKWKDWLAKDPDIDALNGIVEDMAQLNGLAKANVWKLVKQHTARRGLAFDKETKKFYIAPTENPG